MRLQHFALTACLAILATSAFAEDLRKVAEANEKAFIHAMKTKDLTWFQKVAAPDFYELMKSGKKTDRKQAIAEMKQMFGMGNITEASSKILSISKTHGGMIVHVRGRMSMNMQAPGAKKPSKLVDDSTYDESWSKDHGKWMIHSLKTVSEHTTMDGKDISGQM